ncbi:CYTH domain-containing protein [Cellulophaga sp. HaHaR_3_176]|uniref:CYTH domain-containing protein n=1 Tax=Cellulophaga sp. HaHaR_3_176 TaxID=1942464 RepID=UPI001C1FFA47|nr:CYTH domain-containing protein [Cellulophaga sp. HaHaR_3_176]QWX83449.1 CYTH domain-containing protein [Cellulophaga sp. HaHaR_3_176]
MLEIERKFLITSDAYKEQAVTKKRIVQGFLNTNPERTVRVRIKGDQGFLTVKGKGNESGVSRFEWEKEITRIEVEELLKLAEPGIIDKVRYEVKVGNHIFEVDEFSGDNEGLVVAEVELSSENESFTIPDWLGEEVSGITKYYNSQLSKNPFKNWE